MSVGIGIRWNVVTRNGRVWLEILQGGEDQLPIHSFGFGKESTLGLSAALAQRAGELD